MKIMEIVGIDVSKLKLDCCINSNGLEKIFTNDFEGIESLVDWSFENTMATKENVFFVLEHTGLYTHRLIQHLKTNGCLFHIVSGLELKRSMGIARGKNDRVDAKRIAQYGHRMRDELEPYTTPSETLGALKRLMSMRRKLVAQRAGHITTLGEQSSILGNEDDKVLFKVQREIIKVFDLQISDIEKELDRLIVQDPELKNMYRLITSIKGIGPVTARFLIVYTAGFTSFENWRKFAAYCGTAPYPHSSGSSIRGRTKVSHLANKEGKTLLNLCAASAIQSNPEMKQYYERRVGEGKNTMSTLNIIRNKLLSRAFSVVKRGTPYVNTMKYAS